MSHIKYHCHWHLPYMMCSRSFWKSFSSFTLSSHLCRHVLSGHEAPTGQCCWKNRRTASNLFVGLWQWHKLNRNHWHFQIMKRKIMVWMIKGNTFPVCSHIFKPHHTHWQKQNLGIFHKQPAYPTRIGSASLVTTTLMRLWLLLPYTQPRCHFSRQRFGVATSCLPFAKCWYGDRDHLLPGLP